MKPMHLAVLGAVLAVVAVLFFMMSDDDEGRRRQRSDSEGKRASTTTTTDDPDAKEAGAGDESAPEGDLGVSFKVVSADGAAALGAEATLVGARTRNVATDEDGAGAFEGLAPGFYDLQARKGDAIASLSFELKETTDLGTLKLLDSVAIRGRVFDPQGAPIRGARVEVVQNELGEGFDFTKRIANWLKPDAVAGGTKTGEDGAFEIRVQKGERIALRVIAAGFAQDGEPARAYHSDTEGLNFHLFRGTTVAGVVVDADGKPIAGARVMVSDPMSVFARNMPKLETASAGDGAFSMSVTPVQQSMITVRAAGYSVHMSPLKPPTTDLRITLEAGVQLRLRTMDADNPVPAPGVTVFLMYRGGFANGETDDRGELVIDHLPTKSMGMFGGQQQAFLVGGGYVAKMVPIGHKEPVDGVVDVGDIELKRGGTVRGTVLDAKTGKPVPAATVRSFGGLDMQLQVIGSVPTMSDEKGEYELTGVPLGATMVTAQHRDYLTELDPTAFMGMQMGAGGKGMFTDGKLEVERDIKITPAAVVEGVVVDAEGTPVSGATVRVKMGQDGMMLRMLGGGIPEAVSGAEGKFVLRGLKDGKAVKLVATHREYGNSEATGTTPGSGEGVSLSLAEPIRLHGIVVDERGDPIEGVRITATRKGSGNRNRFAPMFDDGIARPAITDAKGEYTVRGAPVGEIEMSFEHEGYRPKTSSLSTRSGEGMHQAGKTTLERGPGITGIVVDEKGNPVAGVAVNANIHFSPNVPVRPDANQGPGRQWANTMTGEDGKFALYGLRDAEYNVQPYRTGSYGEAKKVRSGTTGVRITLQPAGELTGRVTANGQPVVGARIRIEQPGPDGHNRFVSGLGFAQTDAEGRFKVTPLPPNESFTVVIEHNGYATRRAENMTAGGAERNFTLDQGVRIGGVIVDNKGNPVPGARISVRAGSSNKMVQADEQGNFVAGGLGDGEITIHITGWAGFIQQDPIPVTPGDMSVRVVVERGESISGQVTGGKDEELQGVRVEAIDQDGQAAATGWVWQQQRGFNLRGLRPGTYTIRVSKTAEGKWTTLAEVTGVAAGSEDVEVAIE